MSKKSGKSGAGPKETNERALDFRRQLEAHTRTVIESFGALLRYSKITGPRDVSQVDLQINVATASLATAAEGLMRQIREVKLAVLLQDEAAMGREVDLALEKIAAEREQLEKELEVLSNDLKKAYAKASMGEGPEPEGGPKGWQQAGGGNPPQQGVVPQGGSIDGGGFSAEGFGLFDPTRLGELGPS